MRRVVKGVSLAVGLLAGVPHPQAAAGQESPAKQIAEAILAAPAPLRATATVLGVGGTEREGDPLTTLREGKGPLICLADDPAVPGFHVACYHRSLEPYMQLGRRLRAEGKDRSAVMDARFAALKRGDLKMPEHAALYSITAPEGGYDPASGTIEGARRLAVIYVPGATGEEIGLPERPVGSAPWLMLPGTPWAHIMIPR